MAGNTHNMYVKYNPRCRLLHKRMVKQQYCVEIHTYVSVTTEMVGGTHVPMCNTNVDVCYYIIDR